MPAETEWSRVKAAEQAVVAEVKKAEGEVKTVAEATVTEAKKVVADVKEEVKKATVEITADEKLFLSDAELEFMKAQVEIQRLSKITEAKSKAYQDYVEGLFKKYLISKTEFVFDGAVRLFKRL